MFNNLADKFRKWNRDRKYPYDPLVEESNYFKICHDITNYNGESIIEIELLRGPYAGTRYSISDIQILDEKSGKATFDVQVINFSENLSQDFANDARFQKILGDVFHIILENAINNYSNVRKEIIRDDVNEESREDYIEEPVKQRAVRKKGAAVSERGISSGKKRKNSVRGNKKVPPKV